MSKVIIGWLREERDRLVNLVKLYKEIIKKEIPKGSLFIDKKGYVYRKYQEKGKSISKYVGKANSEKHENIIKQINEKKRLKEIIERVKPQIEDLSYIIKELEKKERKKNEG